MGQMKRMYQDMQEFEETMQRLEDTDTELEMLDFDRTNPSISDDVEWWRDQDAELDKEETEALERLAEIQEYRTQGYM